MKQAQQACIDKFRPELETLRLLTGLSQKELADANDLSREMYCYIENGQKPLQWRVYTSLILFFDAHARTHEYLHSKGLYPSEYIAAINQDI